MNKVVAQLIELCSREGHHKVLRNAVDGHYVGQVDLGRCRRRELDLGLLGSLFQTLQRHRVLTQVDLMLGLESLGHVVDQHVIEVVAAEMRIAVGRLDLEYAVAEFQNRDIERTAAEVVYGDLHVVLLLVEAVCQCGRSGLVDDTAHFKTCDFAGLLGRLTLRVGEVCRNGYHRLADLLPEIILGRLLHLLQDDCRDLLRRILAAVDVDARGVVVALDDRVGRTRDVVGYLVVLLAHETLDREYRALGVGNCLTLGRVAYLALSVLSECDYRRGSAVSLRVGDDHGLIALHNCYA